MAEEKTLAAYCKYCGAKLGDRDIYCPKCSSQVRTRKSDAKKSKIKRMVIPALVGFLIGVIITLAAVFIITSLLNNEDRSDIVTTENTDSTSSEKQNEDSIKTDEKLLTVEITFPASMFEGTDMSGFDAATYAQENGFLSAEVNSDGSITVTMTKAKHDELLNETSSQLETTFADMVNSEDAPYIKEITHNDDFSSVGIKVTRTDYENSFDMTPLSIGISVAFYQALLEMEYHCEVTIFDVDTGDVINAVIYPDAFNAA